MEMNRFIRPYVGADLSALSGCSTIPMILVKSIIGQMEDQRYSDYFVKSHYRALVRMEMLALIIG